MVTNIPTTTLKPEPTSPSIMAAHEETEKNLTIKIKPLYGRNWFIWKKTMENVLKTHGLLKYIETETHGDERVQSLILMSLMLKLFYTVTQVSNNGKLCQKCMKSKQNMTFIHYLQP